MHWDNITAAARILASRPPGVSWCTSLFMFWNPDNWTMLGVLEEADGGHFYTAVMRAGAVTETRLASCDLSKWQYVRIELGRDCLRYRGSADGKQWQCLRVVERPEAYGGAPTYVAVGKGYSTGAASYNAPLLSNDFSDRASVVTSRIADIVCSETATDRQAMTPA